MGYTLLSKTDPVARKDHRCIWCGQRIPKGEGYINERSIYDGDMQNHHWHPECWEASKEEFSRECEWEFSPYDNERPTPLVKGDYARPMGKLASRNNLSTERTIYDT